MALHELAERLTRMETLTSDTGSSGPRTSVVTWISQNLITQGIVKKCH